MRGDCVRFPVAVAACSMERLARRSSSGVKRECCTHEVEGAGKKQPFADLIETFNSGAVYVNISQL